MKILFIILDGLADKPIKELGNKTPLEAGETPNLDFLAKHGICGLIEPVYSGAIPTSEEGHFALFGYDPKIYQLRRGIFTAKGAGITLKSGDVALRGNFATVDEKMNIIDRRAGRIEDTQPLIQALNGLVIKGVRFLIKLAGQHRAALVMRSLPVNTEHLLSDKISDGDPHYSALREKAEKIVPLSTITDSRQLFQAQFTAEVLNEFLELSQQILKEHSLNIKRVKQGKLPANYLLVRGASSLKEVPSFRKKYRLSAGCVAGKLLYKQIAKFLGMKPIKVRGANGSVGTNLGGKFSAAQRALKKYDFVFLHIKATDTLAEDGDFRGKSAFVSRVDKALSPILKLKNCLIVVTGDHATCSKLKRHCQEPVPVLIWGDGQDSVANFSERACKHGSLGRIKALELMPIIIQKSKTKMQNIIQNAKRIKTQKEFFLS